MHSLGDMYQAHMFENVFKLFHSQGEGLQSPIWQHQTVCDTWGCLDRRKCHWVSQTMNNVIEGGIYFQTRTRSCSIRTSQPSHRVLEVL